MVCFLNHIMKVSQTLLGDSKGKFFGTSFIWLDIRKWSVGCTGLTSNLTLLSNSRPDCESPLPHPDICRETVVPPEGCATFGEQCPFAGKDNSTTKIKHLNLKHFLVDARLSLDPRNTLTDSTSLRSHCRWVSSSERLTWGRYLEETFSVYTLASSHQKDLWVKLCYLMQGTSPREEMLLGHYNPSSSHSVGLHLIEELSVTFLQKQGEFTFQNLNATFLSKYSVIVAIQYYIAFRCTT